MGIIFSLFDINSNSERSLGVRHSQKPDTSPWNNCELKFRDGMKTLYEQDFQKRKPIKSKPTRTSGETCRFTSPMILNTEYKDYYKPYTIRQMTKT
jgi:hypothetical protein